MHLDLITGICTIFLFWQTKSLAEIVSFLSDDIQMFNVVFSLFQDTSSCFNVATSQVEEQLHKEAACKMFQTFFRRVKEQNELFQNG